MNREQNTTNRGNTTMSESDTIRENVTQYLAERGVTYAAFHRGARTKGPAGNAWECDAWTVTLSRQVPESKMVTAHEVLEEFDYFTGTGHREVPKWGPDLGWGVYDGKNPPRPGTSKHVQWQKLAKPVAPHAADVLHSLILDSSAVGMSFESWCNEYGYDSDSRKAEATYRACQQNADKLVRVLGQQAVDELAELLRDY